MTPFDALHAGSTTTEDAVLLANERDDETLGLEREPLTTYTEKCSSCPVPPAT